MARTTTRLFCACAMHLAHATHTPCAHHACAMRTPCARHAHAMHTPCTRHAMRRYRGAFRTLERAVDWWNLLLEPPTFIAQLGDIIDGVNVDLGQSDSALEVRACMAMHTCHAHATHMPRKCHAHAVHTPCTCHPGGAGDAAPRAVPSGQHRRQPRALQLRPRAAGEGEWRGRVAQARRQGVPQLRACRWLAQHVHSGELRRSQEPAHFWVAPGRVLLCGQC